MRKTINCFIPYRESTAAEQTIHALKESSIVNKIYLLNIEPNKTLSTPEGCEILPVDSLTSSKTMKMIAEKADTPYILLYTKTSALELAYKALERMTDFLQDRECGMVYADHHEWKNGEKKKHPVNDYQPGSVRDDFDFGPLLIFNRTEFILASLQMTEEREYAALYELRLLLTLHSHLVHINEYLYTETESDNRLSGEKQFDYVNPRNREVQIEMEEAFTRYLKSINALLEPICVETDVKKGNFEYEASVIIPVRNRARTIDDAIRSALAQETRFPFNIIIVDEFTGRLMYGRRYSEGLHQAIEAKEGVTVARESKTLATITFQNYFRLYGKLSGMTGTAMTEEEEFGTIYSLDIVEIPTNKPVQRVDHPDVVYKTEAGKFRAIVNQIEECHKKGQPVLVGTISIEKSEELSAMLKKRGIRHNVLNAKFHEKEAEIVAQAGKLGAVTVATNMAGRGTDIMLGGNAEYLAKAELRKAGLSDELIAESTGYADTDNEEILNARKMFAEAEAKYKDEIKAEADQVRAAGGLFILGTERHESRRIDNQLRGRAGRQGDPGESRFYLSLEDDIMRLFGSERVMGMMEKLGVDEDTPIDAKILSNAIENAQKQVESRNFQTRKTVLEYDDVMNTQRKVIYEQRRKVLDGENLKESVQAMLSTVISTEVQAHMGELKHMDAENWREVCAQFRGLFLRPDEFKFTDEELQQYDAQALTDLLQERASDIYARKEAELGEPLMRELERVMMLRVVDEYWMDNIDAMQELRQGIGLRAYGQNDPVVAYKKEGYEMFESMIAAIQAETIRRIFLARVQVGATTVKRERVAKVTGESAGSDGTVKKQPVKKGQKVGRNDPCPCGSGKKYKKCCGMHEDE